MRRRAHREDSVPIARGASEAQIEDRIGELLSELEPAEKVAMLSGHGFMK